MQTHTVIESVNVTLLSDDALKMRITELRTKHPKHPVHIVHTAHGKELHVIAHVKPAALKISAL